MEVIEESNYEMLTRQVAEDILNKATDIAIAKDKVIMALPGGRSVAGILKAFSDSEDAIWKKIHIFMVDERLVSINDSESNYKLLMDSFGNNLIEKGILPKDNLHPFVINKEKEDFGASDYYAELEKYGGKYDIVLLSSGEDGHIGGLYPNHKALSIPGKKFITMNDSPKPPAERMTSSVELIAGASAFLLFIGEGKKDALDMFNNPKIGIIDCPAKLTLWMKEAVVYTDIE